MNWFSKILKGGSGGLTCPEELIQFYQQLGLFSAIDPPTVIQRYTRDHGGSPNPRKPWHDVFLLAYADGDSWADDPEADVCAENTVYSEVLPQWARISKGAFTPTAISERWDSDVGPITLSFELSGRKVSVSPAYKEDWIDLDVLQQINALIIPSGRQFECAVDCNFALVLCLTPEQKTIMRARRQFPFAW